MAAILSAAILLAAAPHPLLPDLDQAYPQQLTVQTDTSTGAPRYRLGFLSAVYNRGRGPLIVRGRRPDSSTPTMAADQLVKRTGGGTATRRGVGTIAYVDAVTHRHWHYLGFDRYELRRARDDALVMPDRKTGFCLGDRYDQFPDALLRFEPLAPVYTGNCAPDDPGALDVTEGISVGYGDDYPPIKEGQSFDVTGLPPGRYYLVHRVNAGRALLESDYSNDAASVLIALRPPAVRVLRRCPETARCPPR